MSLLVWPLGSSVRPRWRSLRRRSERRKHCLAWFGRTGCRVTHSFRVRSSVCSKIWDGRGNWRLPF